MSEAAVRAITPTRDDRADRELLYRVAAGERRALEQLFEAYHRRLLQFLSRLTPQRDTLEAAINDTFWIVWCKAREFRGASRVSTWIMGIAWRCALKGLRHEGAGSADGAQEIEAVDALAAQERSEWLERGLATLPLEQRATLELAYFVGHSCEEIAAIMDCPINTVKARMFQARIKLRNLLPRLGGGATAAGEAP